jgi:hypothetical protein
MTAKSIEAIERKRINDNLRKRKQRAAAKKAREVVAAPIVLRSSNRKWHIGPPAPAMSKAEMRAMFAQACANTAML